MRIDFDEGNPLAKSELSGGRVKKIESYEDELLRIAENHFKLFRRSELHSPRTIVMVAEYLELLTTEFREGDHELLAQGLLMNIDEKVFKKGGIDIDILIDDVIRPALQKEVQTSSIKDKAGRLNRVPSMFSIVTDGGSDQRKHTFSIPVILLHAYMQNREDKDLLPSRVAKSLSIGGGGGARGDS